MSEGSRRDPAAGIGRVTIRDVAAAANVSPMTVSNVINRKLQFVGKATQEVVQREIKRLGYRVQKTGRNLKHSSHRAVGMIIVDESPSFLADPFTAHIVAGLSNTLSQEGFSLAVQGVRHDSFHDSNFMRSFEVDAFCVMLSGSQARRRAMVDALLRLRQPMVLFQEAIRHKPPELCVIRQDDRGGGRLIARHLLDRGARRAVFLAPRQQWAAMVARERGVRAEFEASGPEAELTIVRSATEEFDSAQSAISKYLALHPMPDSIIGGNDRLALAAMALLRSRGISIPDQVRVTGFNAFEPRKYASPLLTPVRRSWTDLVERRSKARRSCFGWVWR
jgi:LacI family transcriptional regulator